MDYTKDETIVRCLMAEGDTFEKFNPGDNLPLFHTLEHADLPDEVAGQRMLTFEPATGRLYLTFVTVKTEEFSVDNLSRLQDVKLFRCRHCSEMFAYVDGAPGADDELNEAVLDHLEKAHGIKPEGVGDGADDTTHWLDDNHLDEMKGGADAELQG